MSHITKIAAVETSTAIWEYDPSLPGNRVLNGSLDVIAAIRTIAIKVFLFLNFTSLSNLKMLRSSHPDNVSRHFKSFRSNVAFKTHLKYRFIATFVGELHIACSVSPTNSARYANICFFPLVIFV